MNKYLDIFNSKLNEIKKSGEYRDFLKLSKDAFSYPFFKGNNKKGEIEAVNWCSNDYLSMSIHPDVIEEVSKVIKKSGIGSGGTRNISGTTDYHIALEKTIALHHKKQSALLFNSAYLANVTAIQVLAKILPDVVFFSDELNHASLIEGIRTTGKDKFIFRHNDLSDLENLLKAIPVERPKVIVFESVYSMSGTVSPITEIIQIAKSYNCITYLDEVHGVGLYGPRGAGLAEACGQDNEIDIINATLAKSFGTIGGYVVGNEIVIDCIRSFGRGFIFTSSIPPSICAGAKKSIEIISGDMMRRDTFHTNVQKLRKLLSEKGLSYSGEDSHITIIRIGNAVKCKEIADKLLTHFGVYTQPINYPTVPKGEECLRITSNYSHSDEHREHLVNALSSILN